MTEKDRRSLAPVPILRLWVRQCLQNAVGQWHEVDLDITYVSNGLSKSADVKADKFIVILIQPRWFAKLN